MFPVREDEVMLPSPQSHPLTGLSADLAKQIQIYVFCVVEKKVFLPS